MVESTRTVNEIKIGNFQWKTLESFLYCEQMGKFVSSTTQARLGVLVNKNILIFIEVQGSEGSLENVTKCFIQSRFFKVK